MLGSIFKAGAYKELNKAILYKLSTIYSIPYYIKSIGLKDAFKYCLLRLLRGLISTKLNITISWPHISYPIIIRTGTSDLRVFESIFIDNEYDFQIEIEPRFIVDAGANVGYSSIYFKNKYPKAKIISIEPEADNYKILKANTIHYKNILTTNSALWFKNTFLQIKDKGGGECAFVVEEANMEIKDSIRAITMDDILKENDLNYIDLLKIDIEGSEKEIFSWNYEGWLGTVNIIIIELHDRFKPGCSEAFLAAVNKYNFIIVEKKNNVIKGFFKR